MLPINLLPNYINERGRKPKLMAFYGGVIAAVIIGAVVYANGIQNEVNKAKEDLATASQKQTTYNAKVSEINKIKGEIAETGTKQTFIANAQTYNSAWSDTYELMRDLTSRDVLLKSMALGTDHKTVNMAAFAANEMIIARWWIDLKNHKSIFDNVTMQIPTHPWAPAGANGPGGAPGSGGFGGSGGFPGSGGGGLSVGGPPAAAGMSSSGSAGGFPGSGGFGGSGGFPGSGGGGGGAAEGVGPAEIEGRSGVNFSVRAVLKTALANGLATPVWGGGAAPAAGPPAFGGAGGGGAFSSGATGSSAGGPSSGGAPTSGGRD